MDFSFLLRFLLCVLAVYRLSEIISIDKISQPIRTWAGRKASYSKVWWWISELLHCPYCVGVWLSFAVALFLNPYSWLSFIIYAFAIAGGQAFLENINERD